MRLASFELVAPLSTGGQGAVWAARHERGHPCVVKFVRSDLAPSASARAWFAREVRAVARLDHPHVVSVFDHGVVPAAVAAETYGALVAGAPWLAMERVSGGPLDGRAPVDVVAWRLRALLSGLAHAHARGVLHLDLKPGNVLVASATDLRPGLRIVDFGIASLEGEPWRSVAGTPQWAAPEQLRGGALGPWTDLYAVGRLAQRWLGPVDDPMLDWADRCAADDPADRFPHAAAALAALPGGAGDVTRAAIRPPEIPVLGLALFAHRVPRCVGRAEELADLLARHRAAVSAGEIAPIVLTGPVGVGRRTLAAALAERAREEGLPPPGIAADPPSGVGLSIHVAAEAGPGSVAVQPLSSTVLGRAVREWLPLSAALADAVVADARGLPGRARRQIAAWVGADRLRWGPDGFALDTEGAWNTARTRPSLPARLLVVLDVLAVLAAHAVPVDRVVAVSGPLGLAPADVEEVLAKAVDLGLLESDGDRVSFVDPVDRLDLLERLGDELRGRLLAAAGAVVRAEVGDTHPDSAPFLWDEGRHADAVEAWLRRSGDTAAEANHVEEALRRVAEVEGDAHPLTLRVAIRRLELLDRAGRPELRAATAAVGAAARLADRRDDAAKVACFRATSFVEDDPDEAIAAARTAVALAEDTRTVVMAAQLCSHLLTDQGRPDEALLVVAAARAHPAPRTVDEEAFLAYVAGVAALAARDRVRAERELLAALKGPPDGPAVVALASLLEGDGRADEARGVLEASLPHAPSARRRVDVRLRLASLELTRGDWARCAVELRCVWDEGPAPGEQEARARLLAAACAARDGDWDAFRDWFGPAAEAVLRTRRLRDASLGGVLRRIRWSIVDAPGAVRSSVDAVIDAFTRDGIPI